MTNYNDNITYDVSYTRFRTDRKIEIFSKMGVRDDEEILIYGNLWCVIRCNGQKAEWIILHSEKGMSDYDAFVAASSADTSRRHSSVSFSTLGKMKAYIARRDSF